MRTATLVMENVGGYIPGTNLYELSEPLDGATFVAVMAVDNPGTQHDETIIVRARADGSAVNMNRLRGSLVGWADHQKALTLAGDYAIVVPEPEPATSEDL